MKLTEEFNLFLEYLEPKLKLQFIDIKLKTEKKELIKLGFEDSESLPEKVLNPLSVLPKIFEKLRIKNMIELEKRKTYFELLNIKTVESLNLEQVDYDVQELFASVSTSYERYETEEEFLYRITKDFNFKSDLLDGLSIVFDIENKSFVFTYDFFNEEGLIVSKHNFVLKLTIYANIGKTQRKFNIKKTTLEQFEYIIGLYGTNLIEKGNF